MLSDVKTAFTCTPALRFSFSLATSGIDYNWNPCYSEKNCNLSSLILGWYHGERLCDGTQGWFPANHTEEILNEHVRARNLRQRYRLLAASQHLIGGTLRI